MHTTKRKFLGMAAGVFALTASLATSAFAEEMTKIRMGYIADYFGTSMVAIATEKGLWAKNGLDAELKIFTNGPI